MVKEDGVRLPRVRAPKQHQIRFRNFAVRTRTAAQSEDCRQTDDTRGVSSAVAAIDIVASDHRTNEFLSDVVQLVLGFRATEHAERLRPPLLDLSAKALGHGIERLIPSNGTKRAVLADHRLGEPAIRWNH